MSLPNSNDKPTAWTDSDGRTWSMAITVNDNRRVLKLLGIDLFDLFDGKLLERLSREPILLVDTLYAVCKPQADERGVSEEQFAELLITGKKGQLIGGCGGRSHHVESSWHYSTFRAELWRRARIRCFASAGSRSEPAKM